MRFLRLGGHAIPAWLIVVVLVSVIVATVVAYDLSTSFTATLEVKEPLSIVHYPSQFSLFPGETAEFNVTVENSAPMNYSVVLDFKLNDSGYQTRYVSFSNVVYNVTPGQQDLDAWMVVATDAPATTVTVSVDVVRLGTGGPALLVGTFMKEDFSDTTSWTLPYFGTVRINPAGQLDLLPGTGGDHRSWLERNVASLPSQFSAEIKCKADSWDTDATFDFQFYTLQYFFSIYIKPTGVGLDFGGVLFGGNAHYLAVTTDTGWHTWTFTFDQGTGIVTAYKDATLVGSWTNAGISTTGSKNHLAFGYFQLSGIDGQAHVDYFYIDSGIVPPSGGS